MFEYHDEYTRMSDAFLRSLAKKRTKPVRHQQTCPVCGRKLVNTYRRDGVWKCKKCWDAAEGGNHG